MGDSDLHMSVEMTGDRRENTSRRAAAFETAINHAASDPGIKLRMALGAAYSDLHAGITRHVIVTRLRDLLADPAIAAAALPYHAKLSQAVIARTKGQLCGDYISKIQLELLSEALAPEEEPPHAA